MNIISNAICLQDLHYLLEFLAAWEKRPTCLTLMAYQWCSAISEAAESLKWSEPTGWQYTLLQLRLGLQGAPDEISKELWFVEREFSKVGYHCDSLRLDDTSNPIHEQPQDLTPDHYADLLPIILEIGFRQVPPSHNQLALHSTHTPHHDWIVETAFSSHDDDTIADVVSMWVINSNWVPVDSYVRYLTRCLEWGRYCSPRLQKVVVHAIECIWCSGSEVSESEILCLLDNLHVDVDDLLEKDAWVAVGTGDMFSCRTGKAALPLLVLAGQVSIGHRLS
jgi:hypothetical protein